MFGTEAKLEIGDLVVDKVGKTTEYIEDFQIFFLKQVIGLYDERFFLSLPGLRILITIDAFQVLGK